MPTLSYSSPLSGLQAVCRSAAKSSGRWFSHLTLAIVEGSVEDPARPIVDAPMSLQPSRRPPPVVCSPDGSMPVAGVSQLLRPNPDVIAPLPRGNRIKMSFSFARRIGGSEAFAVVSRQPERPRPGRIAEFTFSLRRCAAPTAPARGVRRVFGFTRVGNGRRSVPAAAERYGERSLRQNAAVQNFDSPPARAPLHSGRLRDIIGIAMSHSTGPVLTNEGDVFRVLFSLSSIAQSKRVARRKHVLPIEWDAASYGA
jgi:hypothetical protein